MRQAPLPAARRRFGESRATAGRRSRCIRACLPALAFLPVANALSAQTSSCAPPPPLAAQLRSAPTADAYSQLGGWFSSHRRPVCAVDAYRRAVTLDPGSAGDAYSLALSLYSAGKPQQAVAPLQHSLQLDPESLNSHLLLAAVLQQTGDRPAAELQWRAALSLNPHTPLAIENLSRDLLADGNYSSIIEWLGPLASSYQLSAPGAINLSVAYAKSGLLDNAASLLRATLDAHPESVPVVEALAAVLVLQSRVEPAVNLLSAAAKDHPDDQHLRILLLRALVLARDPRANRLADQLLASDPHQWEILYLTGLLRQQAGNFAAARTRYQESLARNPDYPDAHFQLGVVLESLGDNLGARSQLQEALAVGFNSPKIYFDLGRVLHRLGDETAARRQFQLYQQAQRAESHQTLAAARSDQGDLAGAAGNYGRAAADYRQALDLDPQEPLLAYKLAMALERTGDRAGERAALEQAVRSNPHMAAAQNQLGYLDSVGGSTDSAIDRFQLAVQADPGYTKAWMNLAAELCLESRWQDARAALAHVLELDPSSPPGHALLQRLNEIDPQP
jgi:tetratricopeptide (TPR) repeat protein